MKTITIILSAVGIIGAASAASAQGADFNLTYHVERTPAAKLSAETCGRIVAQTARQSGLSADTQTFPGQLVVVKGGSGGAGAFVAQCIVVGATTVSVVQGIDYRAAKGSLGVFADWAYAALKKGAR